MLQVPRPWASPLAALAAATAASGWAAACASAPIDGQRAVEVRLRNPTPMRVWVRFERSAGGAAWTRSVAPRREEEHLVRHRAFGDGPVRVYLIRWPGALHLTKVYGGDRRLRVPPGAVVEVRLDGDLRASTVLLGRPRPAPTPGRPDSSPSGLSEGGRGPGSPGRGARPPPPGTRRARPPR